MAAGAEATTAKAQHREVQRSAKPPVKAGGLGVSWFKKLVDVHAAIASCATADIDAVRLSAHPARR
jgi:hypothetical protein